MSPNPLTSGFDYGNICSMKKQRYRGEILEFVKAYKVEHDYSPSYREIAKAMGIKESGVHRHLHILESEGLITITPGKARSIRVLDHKP